MMHTLFRRFSCLLPALGLLVAAGASAGEPDYDRIADNLVNQSLGVQPGEIIQINGGPDQIDLMAALQVAVAKAGGQPVLQLNIPAANKRAMLETPMEHLERLPSAGIMQMKMFDGIINVVSVQAQNLTAAESQIRDADLASEIVNLTKFQVLNQTGLSALAQANAGAQSVLALLR